MLINYYLETQPLVLLIWKDASGIFICKNRITKGNDMFSFR